MNTVKHHRPDFTNYDKWNGIIKPADGVKQFTLSGINECHIKVKEPTRAERDRVYGLLQEAFDKAGRQIIRQSNRTYNERSAGYYIVFTVILEGDENPYDDVGYDHEQGTN